MNRIFASRGRNEANRLSGSRPRSSLLEKPVEESRFRISLAPGAVFKSGVFGVFGLAARTKMIRAKCRRWCIAAPAEKIDASPAATVPEKAAVPSPVVFHCHGLAPPRRADRQ